MTDNQPGPNTPPSGAVPPPPPPSAPRKSGAQGCLKWGALGCGMMLLLLVIGVFAMRVWWGRNGEGMMAAAEQRTGEGAAFGAGTDEQGCLEEAQARARAGGGLRAAVGNTLFLRACLESSRSTPGFCEEAPSGGSVLATGRWIAEKCRGAPEGQHACRAVWQGVQEFCSSGQPKSGAGVPFPDSAPPAEAPPGDTLGSEP